MVNPFDEILSTRYLRVQGEPGAAVIVLQYGQPVFRQGFGMANLEWNLPIAPDTVFRIGSVTKQFTSTAALLLVEQGKLALDDPLQKFVPDYPTHGHTITVEHLLTHTSGIKSYTDMKEWPGLWGKEFKLNELIDFFKFQPMNFAPGTKWAYNNSGYVLLGAVIEQASGMPYERFLKQNIFDPLGMVDTQLELPGVVIQRRAGGYQKTAGNWQNAAYISMTQPLGAGGLVSTVDDLACWERALAGGQILKPESLQRALTPYRLADGSLTHYGYGWAIHAYQGLAVISHGGGIHGFTCDVLRIPDRGLFVAVLTNRGNEFDPGDVTFRLALAALGLALPEVKPVSLPETEMMELAEVYELWPGMEAALKLERGRLVQYETGGEQGVELMPVEGGDLVNMKFPLVRIRFQRDEGGQVKGFEARNQFDEVIYGGKRKDVQ